MVLQAHGLLMLIRGVDQQRNDGTNTIESLNLKVKGKVLEVREGDKKGRIITKKTEENHNHE